VVHGQQDISRKAAVSMFSGMAYKSITTTGESMEPTTSVWPTAIEEYVRWKKALSPHMPYSPECLEGALSISYAEWPAKRCSDGRIEGESTQKRLTERDKRRQSLGR
jgi:hypothetical protein